MVTQYTDWTGAHKPKCKRGFSTRQEALEWEQKFQQQSAGDLDMSLESVLRNLHQWYHNADCPAPASWKPDDKFDMIAGTNGLLGAADGGFVLYKEKRTSMQRFWIPAEIRRISGCT
ncbi:MAG: Arm DNA-binding domain-containing protein [Vescimonas sp.]